MVAPLAFWKSGPIEKKDIDRDRHLHPAISNLRIFSIVHNFVISYHPLMMHLPQRTRFWRLEALNSIHG